MWPVSREKVCVNPREHGQQHAQSWHSTARSSTRGNSHHPRAGERSAGGIWGHQTAPPLPAWCHLLVSPPVPSPAPNSGHPRLCKAQGCIRMSPAPALQMLLPALATSPPDNVSLQLPLVLSCSPFPAHPSPGIEAGGCRGEQRVGLGWEGKQSPRTTMERVV